MYNTNITSHIILYFVLNLFFSFFVYHDSVYLSFSPMDDEGSVSEMTPGAFSGPFLICFRSLLIVLLQDARLGA